MTPRQGIPTAQQEALQQPAFDPIMLIAALLSGGVEAVPDAVANQGMRGRILADLAEFGKDSPTMAKTLQNALRESPTLVRTLLSAMGRAGRNFTGANVLNNFMNPSHPAFNSWLSLANVPEVDISAGPLWLRGLAARTSPIVTPRPTEAEPFMVNPRLMSPALTLSLGTLRALQSRDGK